LFSTEDHTRRHRDKNCQRTSWLECPEWRGFAYFCDDEGHGGEDLRGDPGPKGNNGAPGSSKIIYDTKRYYFYSWNNDYGVKCIFSETHLPLGDV